MSTLGIVTLMAVSAIAGCALGIAYGWTMATRHIAWIRYHARTQALIETEDARIELYAQVGELTRENKQLRQDLTRMLDDQWERS